MLTWKMNRYVLIALALSISLSAISYSFAQAPQTTPGQTTPPVRTGPEESTISTTYREPKGRPFYDEKLFPKKEVETVTRNTPLVFAPVPPPSFEERDAAWKQKRQQAREGGRPEPQASEKYLVDEVKILGIYRKPDGQGVFLKPSATASTMIFAGVGQEFWNGKITRIEKDKVEFEIRTKLSNTKVEKIETKTEFRAFTRGK